MSVSDAPSNINMRMSDRIARVLRGDYPAAVTLDGEDERVLRYVHSELQPQRIAARPEWDTNVTHLHDVAKTRLRRYEDAPRAVAA